jgi:hypothetical protein
MDYHIRPTYLIYLLSQSRLFWSFIRSATELQWFRYIQSDPKDSGLVGLDKVNSPKKESLQITKLPWLFSIGSGSPCVHDW